MRLTREVSRVVQEKEKKQNNFAQKVGRNSGVCPELHWRCAGNLRLSQRLAGGVEGGGEVSARTIKNGWQAAMIQGSTATSLDRACSLVANSSPQDATGTRSRAKGKNMEMCLSAGLRASPKPFCMHPLPPCHTCPPVFVSKASFLPERPPITAPKPLTGVSCIQLTDSPKPLRK